MPDQGPWRAMSPSELRSLRKNRRLEKGHTLEYLNVTHDVAPGLPEYQDWGDAPIDAPAGPVTPEEPRKVVADLSHQIVTWAHENPQNAHLAAQIVRRHNPESAHMTDEEIIAELVKHYETKAREVTEQVYRDQGYDTGNDVTAWKDGLWLPSSAS